VPICLIKLSAKIRAASNRDLETSGRNKEPIDIYLWKKTRTKQGTSKSARHMHFLRKPVVAILSGAAKRPKGSIDENPNISGFSERISSTYFIGISVFVGNALRTQEVRPLR
jgi:hypothetical protein